MRRVEGEQFAAGLGNPTQFVIFEMRRPSPLVGAVGQVAGAVVAVAGFAGIVTSVLVLFFRKGI